MNKKRTEKQTTILADLSNLRGILQEDAKTGLSYLDILIALEQFMECVRYLNTRRSTGAKLNLHAESDVQDAIYIMLRPWITDLIYENPTDKIGNRFAIKDFLSKSCKTIVEAKFIRNEIHGKSITKELHDDIEIYRHHPHCDHLIFFIYDPDSLIPDVSAIRREMITERNYDGKILHCHILVKP